MTVGWAALLIGVLSAAPQAVDAPQLVAQGRRLVTDGQLDAARDLYSKALAADPSLADAHLAMGILLDLDGDYAKARTHLERAVALADPEIKVAALNAMAVSFAFEKKTTEAARFYQQVYDSHVAAGRVAAAAGTANALGRLYLETGDIPNARRWYQTGYETARRQPDVPQSQLALWQFRWIHAQGRLAARDGHQDEASRHVEAARALQASTPALKDEGPTLAYLAGYVAVYAKDYGTALTELARADQGDPFILMLEAQALTARGDQAAARQRWVDALKSTGHNLQNAFARPEARAHASQPDTSKP
jgi:tetratricopeptide (TPR) repeat protein